MNKVPVMTGNICWYHNYGKHKQLLLKLQYSVISGNHQNEEKSIRKTNYFIFSVSSFEKMLYACTS